jgi:tRNA (cmo5U34)-methyltransferase
MRNWYQYDALIAIQGIRSFGTLFAMKDNQLLRPPGRALSEKSSVEQIRAFFDNDVERFSNLETGQRPVPEAVLVLELLAEAVALKLRPGGALLDLGCGAGNYTLRILREVSPLRCHLVDLSRNMLERARSRLEAAGCPPAGVHQTDLRELVMADNSVDCIVAGAVLHHLRDDDDWERTFARLHRWLKPGGRLFVADVTVFDAADMDDWAWKRFASELEAMGGPDYRRKILEHIGEEDSPRSLGFQFGFLRRAGFREFDVLFRKSVSLCYFATKA